MKTLSRDQRQKLCLDRWIGNGAKGTLECATGFGKTRIALNTIKQSQTKNPNVKVIVVVPNTALQEQWIEELEKFKINTDNISVRIINTASKTKENCDLLILDETHRYAASTFSLIFESISYKWILGLTATFERVDGKHSILQKYAPKIDSVSIQECLFNNWVSNYKEYAVIIDVDDIEVYQELTKQFNSYFEFFDYDFPLAMSMVGPNGWKRKSEYAKYLNPNDYHGTLKQITINLAGLLRVLSYRKKYIYSHPEKFRIAQEIIAHRSDKKIITFCASVENAKSFKNGHIYTGRLSKKKKQYTLDDFAKEKSGILHTVKLAEEGLNLPELSVGIMLGLNSSKTKNSQTRGRVVRYQEGKKAEFFTLILNNTVEIEWWKNSRDTTNYEIIDEENLMKLLRGESYELYTKPLKKHSFKY